MLTPFLSRVCSADDRTPIPYICNLAMKRIDQQRANLILLAEGWYWNPSKWQKSSDINRVIFLLWFLRSFNAKVYTKRDLWSCCKMYFFHNEINLSLIKVLLLTCFWCFFFVFVFYCVLKLLVQRYVGSVVSWTDFEVVASHENRTDFDSQVMRQ